MSGLRDIAKGGWHPKGKDGGKESWRGDNKGIATVAGWMGKGKGPSEQAQNHQSAPLSTLKDPASFGPPPKHAHYHGAAAASASSSSTPTESRQRLQGRQAEMARQEEEANQPPPGPYQADMTGLSTAHLPKPPAFRPGQAAPPSTATVSKPKPSLPPRLPPRQNSHPDLNAPAPPPSYNEATRDSAAQGYINQDAANRLGQAGVSVPGLGVGHTASPPVPPRRNMSSAPTSPAADTSRAPQLSQLQSRFAGMSKASSRAPAPAPAPSSSTGTTWAEKQAALKTAENLRNDPSKVTLGDARGAASTANNFRERHGEQVAAGWRSASGLNQKYGLTNKASSLASSSSSTPPPPSSTTAANATGKKLAPPPPPKRRELAASPGEPPPVPLSSKPKF